MITIAHRLKTIVDYDKILVMDRGHVHEFGTPIELMSKQGGMFKNMCEETGEFQELWDIALQKTESSTDSLI